MRLRVCRRFRPKIDLVVGALVRKGHAVLEAWIDRLSVEVVSEGADEDFGHSESPGFCFRIEGSLHHTVRLCFLLQSRRIVVDVFGASIG